VSAALRSKSALQGWLDAFVREDAFLSRYPYYAHVLASLEPVADPSVPFMGVSLHGVPGLGGRYYLHVNVDALRHAPQFLRGLLLHEVHHIVLGHLAHPRFFGAAQPDLMGLAQEMSANEHIEEPLPSPVLVSHFERFGVRPGQSTLERYDRLCQARAEGLQPRPARDTAEIDEHRWCDAPRPPEGGLATTRAMLEQSLSRGVADAERARERHPDNGRLAGRTPEQLLVHLGSADHGPELFVDWREALRRFVARARAPVHSWSRPSRRFPELVGVVPGRSYQVRTVLRPHLLVVLDTSLSMTVSELAEVARQLQPMSAHARLTIVECDAAISRVYPFRGGLTGVKGRGGTDLRPVFEPSFLRAHAADGVVYFTDGDGPHPVSPPAVPVLWMLTKPSDFGCPWGARGRLVLPSRPTMRAG